MFSAKIDHVAIRLNDIEASIAFPLDDRRAARWKIRQQTADHAAFSLGASDGSLNVIDDVRGFLADAIAAGYRSNGEPGERPRYHGGYHAAYVLDADRNNIEVVNHDC